MAPRLIGTRVDPHDAYVGQFAPDLRPAHLASNASFLFLDCLPRLVAGHRLPGLQADPDPAKLAGNPLASRPNRPASWFTPAATLAALGLFAWSMAALAIGGKTPSPIGRAIRLGLLASSLAVVAGFLIAPNIADSDHYRYLVTLAVPWSAGFGLAMARLVAKGRGGAVGASTIAAILAILMTVDAVRWYDRFGWLDPPRPSAGDPTLAWLDDHREVSAILGDYWDVYRLSFLTGGRVAGAPFPQYPDRFPEIGRGIARARRPVVIVRGGQFGPVYRQRALGAGGRELLRAPGLSIVEWPRGLTP